MNRIAKFQFVKLSRNVFFCLVFCLFFCTANAFARTIDEDQSDYDDSRVARVSMMRGDVQIRRADGDEWEAAAPNLPLVEGDRIATGENSTVEVQFDRDNYLRLNADSILKIVTLSDSGVAVSLPEGALSLRIGRFKKNREFFEIDAPRTTVAVEQEGLYRIDAPQANRSSELLVTVRDGGEARVYTETSGYTVRSNRTARVFLDGAYAGDSDFSAANNRDDFDDWVATREDQIERRRNRDADAYYDSTIFGADDLGEYGEWINTNQYGWVWRPSVAATAAYSDWTPYRYGHWRYLPGYGWTWIADEPWGWATSHYGRWVWVDDYWNWCPHDQYRPRHSRWQAALVIFVNIGRDLCWYPLPYDYDYSYNRRARRVVYRNTTIINNNKIVINQPQRRTRAEQMDSVYSNIMVKVPIEDFGKIRRSGGKVKRDEAIQALDRIKTKNEIVVELPEYARNSEARIGRGREIVRKRESLGSAERRLETNEQIGASVRAKNVSLDERLRGERIFKNRQPKTRDDSTQTPTTQNSGERVTVNGNQIRTGIFERSSRKRGRQNDVDSNGGSDSERPQPRATRKAERAEEPPIVPIESPVDQVRKSERRNERKEERRREQPQDNPTEQPQQQPIFQPRAREPKERSEPRNEPRNEPSPKREESRPEPKREEPKPQREESKRDNSRPSITERKSNPDN